MKLPYSIVSILEALFPTTCTCCGKTLVHGEHQMCLHCLSGLTHTFYSALNDNHTERLLTGRIPFEHATSFLQFQQGNTVQQVIHAMKFHGNSELCLLMGRQMGLDLLQAGRFDDVDLLVPVPLHWRRKLERGYNQSELLCRGIATHFRRPILTRSLVRQRHTERQSMQVSSNRESNVKGAFRVKHPERLEGRHLLLVDDVLTTGATLASCCDALKEVNNLKISIATLSIASR